MNTILKVLSPSLQLVSWDGLVEREGIFTYEQWNLLSNALICRPLLIVGFFRLLNGVVELRVDAAVQEDLAIVNKREGFIPTIPSEPVALYYLHPIRDENRYVHVKPNFVASSFDRTLVIFQEMVAADARVCAAHEIDTVASIANLFANLGHFFKSSKGPLFVPRGVPVCGFIVILV